MDDMSDGANVIRPSHIAAARLKVAIADRKSEKVPDWIRELASRDLSGSAVGHDQGRSSADSASVRSSQPEPDWSRELRDMVRAGRTAEAVALLEETPADRERVVGADHPDTLATRGDLAAAYREAGRTAEAIAVLEQALADRERVLGADHPDTLATRGDLAAAY